MAWQSWIPTLSGRLNDGKWTKTGLYTTVGNVIFYRLKLVANAATPMDGGSTDAQFTLPATARSGYAGADQAAWIGGGGLFDNGSSLFLCTALLSSSSNSTGRIRSSSASGNFAGLTDITSTSPFTWASTDEIIVEGFFEKA